MTIAVGLSVFEERVAAGPSIESLTIYAAVVARNVDVFGMPDPSTHGGGQR